MQATEKLCDSTFPPQPTDLVQGTTMPLRDTSATTAAPTSSSPTPSLLSAPRSSPSPARAMRGQIILEIFSLNMYSFSLNNK